MHRRQWRSLARLRHAEAKALLAAEQWSGAYYLSGYAVECGLKACCARLVRVADIPDKRWINNLHTHSLENLVKEAGLSMDRENEALTDGLFEVNWATAKDWNETARYAEWTKTQSVDMFTAVFNHKHGVMKWVRRNW